MADVLTPTERQRDVLDAIHRLTTAWGHAPTVRELGMALGITSTNGVADHFRRLARIGLVRWQPGRARTVLITPAGRAWLRRRAA